jgi:hypothetical protein
VRQTDKTKKTSLTIQAPSSVDLLNALSPKFLKVQMKTMPVDMKKTEESVGLKWSY